MHSTQVRSARAAAVVLMSALACAGPPVHPPAQNPVPEEGSGLGIYSGRYRLGDDLVISVTLHDGRLELLPSFWRTAQILEPTGPDSFQSLLHPRFKFRFERDGEGTVSALHTEGHSEIGGTATRLGDGEWMPVEHLLNGEGSRALEGLMAAGLDMPDRAIGLGSEFMWNFPSRSAQALSFAEALSRAYPGDVRVQRLLGSALVREGRRAEAASAYRKALDADPDHERTRAALSHLDRSFRPSTQGVAGEGWTIPFSLSDLFRPPTVDEITKVRQEWATRDLSPRGSREEMVTHLEKDSVTYQVRVLSHLVHGSRHYGAVLVPEGASPGCCPVVVDIRGISWNYQPRDISGGLRAMDVLREDAGRFAYVVPGLRGETLVVDGESFLSEGDRRNGWDGAADDVVAFLSVALEATPQADPERIGLYGKSRGGSVALLAAARDSRVRCVVDWAGPADWFSLMGTSGWKLQELVEDGLRQRWKPGEGRGSSDQFIEWFLEDPIRRGAPDLEETRLRILASSPLHFVETLPAADLHYGVEDRSVPVENGRALRDRLAPLQPEDSLRWTVHFHEGAGHDMPWPRAYDTSRAFLVHHLAGAR